MWGKRVESDERSSSRPGATCEVVSDVFPAWVWTASQSGTGLWADTHNDSSALAEAAKRVGVRLAPGPGYSAYDGQRTMVRLPVWHEPESLEKALGMLRRAISDR